MDGLPEGTVTFLLTDLKGSTTHWESNPGAMGRALERHDEILAAALASHRGVQVEAGREGDSVLAVFRRADDAAACALAIQRGFRSAAWPRGLQIAVRIALHTGEAHQRAGHYFGAALNRCARTLTLCHPGQILVTRATREILADGADAGLELRDLGLHQLRDLRRPEHLFQLGDPAHPVDFPPPPASSARTNLPARLTSFVGREQELARLRDTAAGARLLTLTGPGGCGKTSLATELAAGLLPEIRDGVWFVDLAPLSDPLLVPRAVAAALDVSEQPGRPLLDTLAAHCADRELLIVLDNCEHLVQACADLCLRLLNACPQLRLVATSREALGVPGETVRAVPALAGDAAVRLFLDRARATASGFDADGPADGPVAEIVERLEHMPLAIELAAARVAAMRPVEILRRLQAGGALLSGGPRTASPRQQTLEGAIDWSYQLLPEAERRHLREVSVFAGSFSLDAVDEIAAGGFEVLAQLIAKSLVQRQGDRYRCLDTIRAFARVRLEAAGEAGQVRGRHAAYYLVLAGDRGPGQLAPWLDRIELELDNLRDALAWGLASDVELAAELSHRLYAAWIGRGHVNEARRVLASLLEALPVEAPSRRTALTDAASFAYTAGDFDSARAQAALALEGPADHPAASRARLLLGVLGIVTGDAAGAEHELRLALEMSRQAGDGRQAAETLHHLGVLASRQQDYAAARRLLAESLEGRRSLGRVDESGSTLTFLAAVELLGGEFAEAGDHLRLALEMALPQRDRRAAWSLDVLACLAVLEGELERGIRLAGAAAQMFEVTGQRPAAGWRAFTEPMLERARAGLGENVAGTAWEAGRSFSFEEALFFALSGMSSGQPPEAASPASPPRRSRS